MKLRHSNIEHLYATASQHGRFRTAVSLHSHTLHSKEGLGFVPRYASQIPILSSFFAREREHYFRLNGTTMDFKGWYWTPPLAVQTVFESEIERIEHQLGVQALVSVTDHDDIAPATVLKTLDYPQEIPISVEWTVPVDHTALHLGLHNLPPEMSESIMNELALYTLEPKDSRFGELLSWLNNYTEVLVVLNHPLSDLNALGIRPLKSLLMGFLSRYHEGIQALEINGYRSWGENRALIAMAEHFELPLISGGDRHGCAPNAILNLTNASTFSEFVSEIRYDKASHVLVMPEYREDLFMRKLESVADFFRCYPEYPYGLRRWTDRVFIQLEDGVVRPLSNYWHRTVPPWVRFAMWLVGLVGSKHLQPSIRMASARKLGLTLWKRFRAQPS